jgi:hypothetical protein
MKDKSLSFVWWPLRIGVPNYFSSTPYYFDRFALNKIHLSDNTLRSTIHFTIRFASQKSLMAHERELRNLYCPNCNTPDPSRIVEAREVDGIRLAWNIGFITEFIYSIEGDG